MNDPYADFPQPTVEDKAKRYRVTEVFPTLQGEGMYSGANAVFVRLAGCNLWSGREKDRQKSAEEKTRTYSASNETELHMGAHDQWRQHTGRAACPLWCDTEFDCREELTAEELAGRIGRYVPDMVVFTGGEPMLQLDYTLLLAVRRELDRLADFPNARSAPIAVETNGMVPLNQDLQARFLDHICVSPKLDVSGLRILQGRSRKLWERRWSVDLDKDWRFSRRTSELKLVWPSYNPVDFREIKDLFDVRYVSPEADPQTGVIETNEVSAAALCTSLRGWRLSLQDHKHVGMP